MTSKYRESHSKAWEPPALLSLPLYFDVIHGPFYAAPLKVECALWSRCDLPYLQRCPLVSTAFFVLFRFSVWNAGTMVVKRVTEKNERSRCTAQLFLHLDFSALSLSAFTQSPFHLSLHKNLTFLYDSLFLPFLPPGCVVDCLTPLGE